jgi:uncharacterized Zn-binding protein involved in type VI secretion
MKRLFPFACAALLVGCAERHPYTGTVADAERAIAAKPMGLTFLVVEAHGDTWVRYRIAHDTCGIFITNGTATVRVEGGRVAISGPAAERAAIGEALKVR